MTEAEAIENALPNGFHDSHLRSLQLGYDPRRAALEFELNIDNAEGYRAATLEVAELVFAVVEAPRESVHPPGLLDAVPGVAPGVDTPPIPDGACAHSFFLAAHNSWIVLCGRGWSLRWHS